MMTDLISASSASKTSKLWSESWNALPPLRRLRAAKAEKSLRIFSEQAWEIVVPAPYIPGWYCDGLCQHFQAVVRGEIKRLLVTIPPRFTKSTLAAVMLPAWVWTTNPGVRMLYASYAESLAVRDATTSRRLLQSSWYRQNWGGVFELAGDMNLKHRYENDHGGLRLSVGIGGSITGEGGDILTIDDAHNIKEVESAVVRNGVLDWFDQVWSTRANDPRTAGWIVIGQRSHADDLPNHLLEMGNWEHLDLPMEFEGDKRVTSIGWSDPRQEEGELLCPARFGPEEAAEVKKNVFVWAAQYQQHPAPAGGAIWKRDWMRYYDVLPSHFDLVIASWDLTFKSSRTSDYAAGQLWGRVGNEFYLLDQIHARMNFTEQVSAIRELNGRSKHVVNATVIEEAASGAAAVDQLKREVPGLVPVRPKGDKEARAMACSALFSAGNVRLPVRALEPWVDDMILEWITFPAAKHDDRVDAASQALLYLQRKKPQFDPAFMRSIAQANNDLKGNWHSDDPSVMYGQATDTDDRGMIIDEDGRRIKLSEWERRVQ
jgi:predicted phage terminase large subunit-like protein